MAKVNTFTDKSIFMADRGYGSLNLFEVIHRIDNFKYLFHIKNNWLTEVKVLPMKALDTEITFKLRTTQTKEDIEIHKSHKAKYISSKSKFNKYKTHLNLMTLIKTVSFFIQKAYPSFILLLFFFHSYCICFMNKSRKLITGFLSKTVNSRKERRSQIQIYG